MSNILNDYKCPEHGYFEGTQASCPEGCSEGVMMVFLKAPGFVSGKTKKNDKTLKQLALDYKMTDIKSTREGESQSNYLAKNNPAGAPQIDQPREQRPGDSVIWGDGGGKKLSMGNIMGGGAFAPVRDEQVGFNPNQNGNLTGPRSASYIPDHENLAIKK